MSVFVWILLISIILLVLLSICAVLEAYFEEKQRKLVAFILKIMSRLLGLILIFMCLLMYLSLIGMSGGE